MPHKLLSASLASVAVLLSGPVSAQTNLPIVLLIGSWQTMTTLQGQAPGPGLVTFNGDGTVIDTEVIDGGGLGSPGHGAWRIESRNAARFEVRKLRFNADGDLSGSSVVDGTVVLKDANNFQVSASFTILNTSGQVFQSLPFTAVGTRIVPPSN